jgi:hypothetical protein
MTKVTGCSEAEWEMEYWNSLTEEQKDEIGKKAKALFNSDKSPLCFMVQSAGSIGPSKLTKGNSG